MFTTDLRVMGENEASKSTKTIPTLETKEYPRPRPRLNLPAVRGFLSQFPGKIQNLRSRFKRPTQKDGEPRDTFNMKDSKFSLEKQMQAWRKNPVWDDGQPLGIEVDVPKGSLCQLSVKANVGLPPDAIYNIVTDPDNKRVFKNIQEVLCRKVLVDEGSRQVVEIEQAAIWRFLCFSGTISVHVLVDQNRDDYSMTFKQIKPGFMKRFEGRWKLEPLLLDETLSHHPFKSKTLSDYMSRTQGNGRIGSKVTLQQLIEPSIVPPPPISWYLRGITARTVEMMMNDLLDEAARIKGVSATEPNIHQEFSSNELKLDEITDIKERWALRRRKLRLRSSRY